MTEPDTIRRQVRSRLHEQGALVRQLLRQREQLRGSLFLRYGTCGKANCVCRTGRKHGPYYVLSSRSAGRGTFAYLDGDELTRARELLGRHREFRRGLARLRRLNAEVVVLLRRYGQAVVRRGGERLGIAPGA
ncbi:MAG: hypothetical protein DMF81_16530 [Acidobacteria bacterium]|nr:MAG: hypothetical protein DMF81_16530 [Acidobacteriota bacterium]